MIAELPYIHRLKSVVLRQQRISHSQTIPRESNILSTPITWQAIQKKNVVKQNVDYSCGSASLATILTYFYDQPTTEAQVIKDLALNKQMASFQDLANVSQKYGFIGRGIATNYDSLKKIKIPAIVYLNHNRTDHFSVLRAIDDTHVYLADPSWGNRTLTRKQFEKIWNTRNDAQYQGKVLLILPTGNKLLVDLGSFGASKK